MTIPPLFSVIIPTHNRSRYAVSCVNSILNSSPENFEVVLHDTSDNEDLDSAVSLIKDPRLKYVHCREQLSMTENHNRAMSIAQGEYLIVIGDDDTINPQLYSLAIWAKNNKLQILSQRICSSYVWPDFRSKWMGNRHSSRLYFDTRITGRISKYNSKHQLQRALENAGQGAEKLPKIYHGLISRTLFENIKNATGQYFWGTSPDMSGALALCNVTDHYYEIDYPLSIPGASGGSNTGRSAMKKHKGSITSDSHTKRFKSIDWNPLVPEFVSVENVWAQTTIESLTKFSQDYVKRFNWYKLYALCLVNHFDQRSFIYKSVSKFKKQFNFSFSRLVAVCIATILKKTLTIIKRVLLPTPAHGRDYITEVSNLEECVSQFNKYLQKKSINPNLSLITEGN